MNIVMLEPLGIDEQTVRTISDPIIKRGHSFLYCGESLSNDEKLERAKKADILIIANSPLSADIIESADNLKMISVGFTGIDHIDMEACRKRNITVCNAQGYATDSTAELTVGLMLSCLRNIVPYTDIVKNGGTFSGYRHNTLRGKTIGIIGTGSIGLRVAEITKAFGCDLIGFSRHEKAEALSLGMKYMPIDDVFRKSDIVTLHTPLTEDTRGIANRKRIFSMKKSAFLINCARGPLVDSKALADALNSDMISGAGIDVFETEPPIEKTHPLLNSKNTILTPHVGFISEESMNARAHIVCDNITAWLDGNPINVK